MSAKKLCDVLNLNNHNMIVIDDGKAVSLKTYNGTPRTEYHYAVGEASWRLNASVINIKNLSLPFQNMDLVVSRETLRAINELEVNLLKTNDLWKWLLVNREAIETNNKNIKDMFKSINSRNLERKWPAFKEWIDDNIMQENRSKYLKDIKKYVARDDLWCPGPRVKDKDDSVIACRGLMQIDSFWVGILW